MSFDYPSWVRSNPDLAKNVEQMARMLVMMWSDPKNLLQFEAGMSFTNVLGYINKEILDPATSTSSATTPSSALAARRFHRILCEVQCVIELYARQRTFVRTPWVADRVVIAIEATKSAAIVLSKWANVRLAFSRAAASLKGSSTTTTTSSPSAGADTLVIPHVAITTYDPVTGQPIAAPFTSWREWVRLFVDVLYLVRPVWYAAFALRSPGRKHIPAAAYKGAAGAGLTATANLAAVTSRRSAWRAWVMSLILEGLLVLLTAIAEYGAPPVITDNFIDATREGGDDGAAPQITSFAGPRFSALFKYLLRNPFFAKYLRGFVQRWIVRGWFARNVPLLGSLLAFQTQCALRMQRESFLYTSGGATAIEATSTFC